MREVREVIVLVGRNGVGKDFFAETIQAASEEGTVKTFAFGDAVKKTCLEIYPWIPRECFYDNALKDVVFEHPNNKLGKTPRQIIHHISSSLQHIDDQVFTRKTLQEFKSSFMTTNALHIITDMRIQREFEALSKLKNSGVQVTFIKILDGTECMTAPKDIFEEWTDAFDASDFNFLNNKKTGPAGVLHFVKRFKIC